MLGPCLALGNPITRCSAQRKKRHKIAQVLLDFRVGRSVCVSGFRGHRSNRDLERGFTMRRQY